MGAAGGDAWFGLDANDPQYSEKVAMLIEGWSFGVGGTVFTSHHALSFSITPDERFGGLKVTGVAYERGGAVAIASVGASITRTWMLPWRLP